MLLGLLVPPPASAQAYTPIELTHAAADPIQVTVALLDRDANVLAQQTAASPGMAEVRLSEGVTALRFSAAGYRTVAIPGPEGTEALSVALEPGAEAIVRLPHASRAHSVSAHFARRSLDGSSLLAETAACALAEAGALACSLPASALDVCFRVSGHIPACVWDLELDPSTVVDLGTIAGTRGTTIVGWAFSPDGFGGMAPAAWATLEPVITGRGVGGSAERSRVLLTEQSAVGSDGSFSLSPVAAGDYQLHVAQAELTSDPRAVTARPDQDELIVDEVFDLRPHGVLRLTVSPAWPPWSDEPWLVGLRSQRGESSLAAALPNGLFDSPPLPVGRYWLRVQTADEAFRSKEREVELLGEEGVDLLVDLPLVAVSGRLMRGDTGVRGTIWFGGKNRAEAARASSDDAGSYRALLPRGGTWPVEIEIEDRPRVRLADVEVDGASEVHLLLPDTRLEVLVLDESSRAARGAVVSVVFGDPGPPTIAEADTDGHVLVEGLPADVPLTVNAVHAEGQAPDQLLRLAEGIDAEVTLRLEKGVPFEGVVVGAGGGPVARASVSILRDSAAGPLQGFRAVTDAAGRFSAALPNTDLTFVFEASGYPLTIRHLRRSSLDAAPTAREFALLPISGSIAVKRSGEQPFVPERLLVSHLGGTVTLAHLLRSVFRGASGDTLVFGPVEPGPYSIGWPGRPSMAYGELFADQQLVLEIGNE